MESGETEVEFRTTDPAGVEVECRRRTWRDKILRGHQELDGRQADAVNAIADPDTILRDRDFPWRRHYVREERTGLFMVVVEYVWDEEGVRGEVVTCFFRTRLREGDVVLYSREEDGGSP